VVYVGTAGWLAAFLLLLPYYERLITGGRGSWLWTCLAGFGLGLWGIHLMRRREAVRARPKVTATPPGPAEPESRPPRRRSAPVT
jgi:hypothetical protein